MSVPLYPSACVCVSLCFTVCIFSLENSMSLCLFLCVFILLYMSLSVCLTHTHTHFIRCALTSFTGKKIWYACFLFQRYSWSGLQLESEFHWAIIICSCVTFLTPAFKVTFQPSSLKRLECCKVLKPEIYTGNKTKGGTLPSKQKFQQNLATMGCVVGQLTSPGVLSFKHTTCSHLIPTRISLSLRDFHHPLVSQKFRVPQPRSQTSLGLFHRLHHSEGTVQKSFRTKPTVPRRRISLQLLSLETHGCKDNRSSQERELGARVLSCTLTEVCGFIYVAFILCMKKHSSGIGFSYVRFLFFSWVFHMFLWIWALFKVTG